MSKFIHPNLKERALLSLLMFSLLPTMYYQCKGDLRMPQDYWSFDKGVKSVPGNYQSVAVRHDKIYTGSNDGTTITVFDNELTKILEFGAFINIVGIAVDSSENIHVLDRVGDPALPAPLKLQSFAPDGELLNRDYGQVGNEPEPSASHSLLAIDNDDNLFVLDNGNFRILMFNSEGNFVREWGERGLLPGQLFAPGVIAVTKDNNLLYTEDRIEKRILQVYNKFGELIKYNSISESISEGGLNEIAITPDNLLIGIGGDGDAYSVFGSIIDGDLNFIGPLLNLNGDVFDYLFDLNLGSCKGINFLKNGDLLYCEKSNYFCDADGYLKIFKRKFNVDPIESYNPIPHPYILGIKQSELSTYLDIEYKIIDVDDNTVNIVLLCFEGGKQDLNALIKMEHLLHGVAVGEVEANQIHKTTWNISSDWQVGQGDIDIEIMAKDERGLHPFHFIKIPANEGGQVFSMTKRPVSNEELFHLWYWLIGMEDSRISFENGIVYGNGGHFDGIILAAEDASTSAGRNFLLEVLEVRAPTENEIARAQAGNYGFDGISNLSAVKIE